MTDDVQVTPKRIVIKVTKKQAELVEWALDPMNDYWCSPEGAIERTDDEPDSEGPVTPGPIYTTDQLPILEGLVLTLSPIDDINSDLHYRTTVQMVQMTDQSDETAAVKRGQYRTCVGLKVALKAKGVKHWFDGLPDLTETIE